MRASSRARYASVTRPDASPNPARAPMTPRHLARLRGALLGFLQARREQLPVARAEENDRRARAPLQKLAPQVFFDPLHPREPRLHASHKARHRGGPGAKEDVMEAIDTRVHKSAGSTLSGGATRSWMKAGCTVTTSPISLPATGMTYSSSSAWSAERRRGIPRGGLEPRGTRTAGGCLSRRSPRLRGRPGQVRHREHMVIGDESRVLRRHHLNTLSTL